MKRFYSKFRFGLITFTLGLASVYATNGLLQSSNQAVVELPKVQYEPSTVFFHLPKNDLSTMFSIEKKVDDKGGGGASGGVTCDEAKKRAKNKKIKISNCD